MTENRHSWALILAAGASSRFGSAKALAAWDKGTLLSRALETARQVFDTRVVVVTGGYAEQVQQALSSNLFVFNRDWQKGMGTSIAAGAQEIMRLDKKAQFITLFPVDQPFVTADHLENLVSLAQNDNLCALSQDKKIIGPPACIPSSFFSKLASLSGIQGLKAFLQPEQMKSVDLENVLTDIDTIDDLKNLKI